MANMWSLNIDMRQFADDLRRLPSQMHDAAASVNKKSADEFERTVRRNMPHSDEGPHIADTIEHTLGDAKYAEHIVSIGNDQLPYGAALEFGHTLNGQWIEGAHVWQPSKKLVVRKHRKALVRALRKLIRNAVGM